jgi:hypothetical protein
MVLAGTTLRECYTSGSLHLGIERRSHPGEQAIHLAGRHALHRERHQREEHEPATCAGLADALDDAIVQQALPEAPDLAGRSPDPTGEPDLAEEASARLTRFHDIQIEQDD